MIQQTFDFIETEEIELERTTEDQKEYEAWKKKKSEARKRFVAMQNLPYEVKIKRAEQRAFEFIGEMENRGCNAHVSVGGLDSITLLLFLRKIGIDIPAISVSSVEDKSIQEIHKILGVEKGARE